MATGRIQWFDQTKNFGLIKDAKEEGLDVFLHGSQFQGDKRALREGASVVFDKGASDKKEGRIDAYNVRLQETSPGHQSSDSPPFLMQKAGESDTPDNRPAQYFHNPYTFVLSPLRPDSARGTFADDFDPLKHGLNHTSLQPDLWTGHLPIKLTVVTPLVLPDAGCEDRSSTKHQTYDMLDRVPESSLRGMLRSAYETVTNSRYGCFKNDDRLAYRVGRTKKNYKKRPDDFLDASLKPAAKLGELSPADRLFGWTPQGQGNDEGYKGRIRVVCEDGARPGIIEKLDGNLPLTILGQPKPAQGRFYVAKDGKPQDDGTAKQDAGYDAAQGKSLRGRKQYWHHKGLETKQASDYWKPSVEDRTQQLHNGRYQEYRRPNGADGNPQADSQNRSITGWIKPGTVFSATLYVQNLQSEEVGGLLWLLSLPEGHYFRLGYGKPLGFGSVRLEIDADRCGNKCLPLGTGADWKAYYAVFEVSSPATLGADQQKCCLQAFKTGMVDAYDPLPAGGATAAEESREQDASGSTRGPGSFAARFDDLSFIRAFLQVLSGPTSDPPIPIHYPRLAPEPNPAGENFRWFTQNERKTKCALPAVTDTKGLPYQP